MDEMMDLRNQDDNRELLTKWLKLLLTVQIVSLAVSVVSTMLLLVPVGGLAKLTDLLGKVLGFCVILVLYKLSPVNERYRFAFIASLVAAAGTIAEQLTFGPGLALVVSLVSLAGSIGGIVALYQEYHGHSEIAEAAGASDLSRKWCSLFVWQFVVGLVISGVTIMVTMIGVAAETDLVRLVAILVPVVSVPALALEAVYLTYLKKTLALVE